MLKSTLFSFFKIKIETGLKIPKPITKKAFPLTFDDGKLIPKPDILNYIQSCIKQVLAEYDGFFVYEIIIRAYYINDIKIPLPIISAEDILSGFHDYISPDSYHTQIDVATLTPKVLRSTKRSYSSHIPQSKKSDKPSLSPFLVADTETLLINNAHVPYAIGVMLIKKGICSQDVDTFFSEDFTSEIFTTFEEHSTAMLKSFIFRIHNITAKSASKIKTIYFHNLSRFDGIFILKHLILRHPSEL